jgi:hypothetical protein
LGISSVRRRRRERRKKGRMKNDKKRNETAVEVEKTHKSSSRFLSKLKFSLFRNPSSPKTSIGHDHFTINDYLSI